MDATNSERSILLIEDDPNLTNLILEVLGSSAIDRRAISIADGIQAMDFLHQRGDYRSAPRPDLILLELNLPGKDGRELLAEIKASPELRRIPIVVLTTAASEADVLSTYALQANCHVVKATDLDRLAAIVKRIEEFWFGIVTLPVS